MLSAQEVTQVAATAYPPQKLQSLQDQTHMNSIKQRAAAIEATLDRKGDMYSVTGGSAILAITAVAGYVLHSTSVIAGGIATAFLLALFASFIWPLSFTHSRGLRRARAESISAPQLSVQLHTYAKQIPAGHVLITELMIESESTVIEQIPFDPHHEESIALAARIRACDEQALAQIHQWYDNPCVLEAQKSQQLLVSHLDTVEAILSGDTPTALSPLSS